MPRPKTVLQSEFPYHIGARSINREWFELPMCEVWQLMAEQLHFVHHAFKLRIHAFVLMHNHFHLIASTPDGNLSEAMAWFMRETSRSLTRAGNRINQSYGGRHYRSVMATPIYYLNAYKYLYRNPVQAGLCESVQDYPFSTLSGLLGHRHLLIPVGDDQTLFSDIEGTLSWLNHQPKAEDWEAVKRALHRPEFAFPRPNNRPHHLEFDAL